ncbi:MAG: helix-hairpin-helix domain-containing protein [Candidatus Hydrogenedentota bacterium]
MDFKAKDVIAVLILVALIGIGSYFLYTQKEQGLKVDRSLSQPLKQDKIESTLIVPEQHCKDKSDTIVVYIEGGVKKPGIYQVKSSCRLYELIEQSGGFTEQAIYSNLNPAKKLIDGEKIIVPERLEKDEIKEKVIEEKDLMHYAMEREAKTQLSQKTDNKQQVETTEIKNELKININTAALEELQKLPRIGPKTAKSIIEYREKHNGFKSIEELREVPRIGDKTFENLKDKVTIN